MHGKIQKSPFPTKNQFSARKASHAFSEIALHFIRLNWSMHSPSVTPGMVSVYHLWAHRSRRCVVNEKENILSDHMLIVHRAIRSPAARGGRRGSASRFREVGNAQKKATYRAHLQRDIRPQGLRVRKS